MIELYRAGADEAEVGHVVLRPNRSFSWRATVAFLGVLLFVSCSIALFFLIQGYWLILPFSVLEVTFVGACFYVIQKRASRQQVITLSEDEISLTEGIRTPRARFTWQRFFTRILLREPRYSGHRPTLSIRHRAEEVEIGEFLTAEEKRALARHLSGLIELADQRQRASAQSQPGAGDEPPI